MFPVWTDKQKRFYLRAKCNLTLQTSSIHWNILLPRTAQRRVQRHPDNRTPKTVTASENPQRGDSGSGLPCFRRSRLLKFRVKFKLGNSCQLCHVPVKKEKTKQQCAYCSLAQPATHSQSEVRFISYGCMTLLMSIWQITLKSKGFQTITVNFSC